MKAFARLGLASLFAFALAAFAASEQRPTRFPQVHQVAGGASAAEIAVPRY